MEKIYKKELEDVVEEIINLKIYKKEIELNDLKKQSHKKFLKKNKNLFVAIDILMAMIILSNFGAVFITNLLVIKEEYEPFQKRDISGEAEIENIISGKVILNNGTEITPINFTEANPILAEREGLKLHPEAKKEYKIFVRQSFLWAILTFLYLSMRKRIRSNTGLSLLIFFMIFYSIITFRDFISNLGFWIGMKIWGGA